MFVFPVIRANYNSRVVKKVVPYVFFLTGGKASGFVYNLFALRKTILHLHMKIKRTAKSGHNRAM